MADTQQQQNLHPFIALPVSPSSPTPAPHGYEQLFLVRVVSGEAPPQGSIGIVNVQDRDITLLEKHGPVESSNVTELTLTQLLQQVEKLGQKEMTRYKRQMGTQFSNKVPPTLLYRLPPKPLAPISAHEARWTPIAAAHHIAYAPRVANALVQKARQVLQSSLESFADPPSQQSELHDPPSRAPSPIRRQRARIDDDSPLGTAHQGNALASSSGTRNNYPSSPTPQAD